MWCKHRLSVYNISLNRNKKSVNLPIPEVETILGLKIFDIGPEDVGNCFRTLTYEMQRAHWALLIEMKRIEGGIKKDGEDPSFSNFLVSQILPRFFNVCSLDLKNISRNESSFLILVKARSGCVLTEGKGGDLMNLPRESPRL